MKAVLQGRGMYNLKSAWESSYHQRSVIDRSALQKQKNILGISPFSLCFSTHGTHPFVSIEVVRKVGSHHLYNTIWQLDLEEHRCVGVNNIN